MFPVNGYRRFARPEFLYALVNPRLGNARLMCAGKHLVGIEGPAIEEIPNEVGCLPDSLCTTEQSTVGSSRVRPRTFLGTETCFEVIDPPTPDLIEAPL